MSERGIEITMQPAYQKFNYIYIPARYTGFFPAGEPKTKFPIQIDTDKGTITTELQYNNRAHV